MKGKNLITSALVLVLVCCLIFNMCTIPTKALGTLITGVVSGKAIFDTVAVIAAACIGLGVAADLEQRGVFDEMVNSIKETLGLGDTMEVSILSINDVARYHVPEEFISSIRDTLWGNKIILRQVSGSCAVKAGQVFNGYTITASCYGFNYGYNNSSKTMILCSLNPFSVVYPDGTVKAASGRYNGGLSYFTGDIPYTYVSSYPSYSSSKYGYEVCAQFLKGQLEFAVPETEVVTVPGLIGSAIPEEDTDLATGYPGWWNNAVVTEGTGGSGDTDPDDTPVLWFPIGLQSTYDDTVQQVQDEVQDPEPIEDVDPDDDPGTVPGGANYTGILSSILNKLGEIVNAIVSAPGAIVEKLGDLSLLSPILDVLTSIRDKLDSNTDSSSESSDVHNYTLDLKSFFPFCIPFDIYNMLNAFRAEPVTPRWELNLQFGALGSYPVVIDLAPWDQLAAVCRTFQVVVFCIGLAAGTKKLLGW